MWLFCVLGFVVLMCVFYVGLGHHVAWIGELRYICVLCDAGHLCDRFYNLVACVN